MSPQGDLPDPEQPYPIPEHHRVAFLRPFAKRRANVSVGAWTYADDPAGVEDFFDRRVLYHFDFIGDRLEIGRFCAIAEGARFVMNGGTHAMGGLSTFPFEIMGLTLDATPPEPAPRDTVIGHDVWIGREAMVMPGVSIGSGAIVGAGAVVTADVRPYAIVAGNPAREIRRRVDDATAEALLELAWWNWPTPAIAQAASAIRGNDLDALRRLAP